MLHAGVKIVCHLLVTALDMHHLACKKEVGYKRRRGEGGRNIQFTPKGACTELAILMP